ncbi:MAG: class I SAM-dependent methyltransferase [archaeon]|nr:class I SAM-dependent methyltransferase [archaeon]
MSEHHGMPKEEEIFTLKKQLIKLTDFKCQSGWILDIGGGGEGFIGLVKGERVIAIDLSKRELSETKNNALKLEMDARELKFVDNSFNTVTAFFSVLYIKKEEWDAIFSEINRVLKPGGEFLIWDANFKVPSDENKKMIVVPMIVTLPDGKEVDTGYGVQVHSQNLFDFIKIAEDHKFKVTDKKVVDQTFFLRIKKD